MKPREKFLRYGPQKLESWELIATILGTGTKQVNVFTLAKKAAKLIELEQEDLSLDDLLNLPGIWKVKALQIMSGFELAKRHYFKDDVFLHSSKEVFQEVEEYSQKRQEYLIVLTLDGAKRLIHKRVVTIGLLDQSLAHPREIFSGAIEDRAHSIILVHNHPSGNTDPSGADMQITSRIMEAGKIVGIHLLDHLVIAKKSYYSFRENSLIS